MSRERARRTSRELSTRDTVRPERSVPRIRSLRRGGRRDERIGLSARR